MIATITINTTITVKYDLDLSTILAFLVVTPIPNENPL